MTVLYPWSVSLFLCPPWASQVALVVKNLHANAGVIRDTGSIPGSGRSPGGGNGNPFQFSCLDVYRGLWWATVLGNAELDMTENTHGEGNGNPLQCSCLENPRDGGAWWAAVYGVAQSRTRLKRLSSSSSSSTILGAGNREQSKKSLCCPTGEEEDHK